MCKDNTSEVYALELTAELIKELAADTNNIIMSSHANMQCLKRKINSNDVLSVLRNGEIIEYYPTDYPYPSCLELGFVSDNRALHVCCAIGDDKLWVITAYYPTADKWESDMKTRKAVE